MPTYDAIVVGARCAGAATAMLLARAGASVLLVDRARFPSDIPHGHFIHRDGPGRLARWGLLDDVVATGAPPVTSFVQDLGDFPLRGTGLEVGGVPLGIAPRRSVLDALLVQAAVDAGAELRDGEAVLAYTTDGKRVTGIRGRSATERADLVIGADGRNSLLASTVQAPVTTAAPTQTCWYFTYLDGAGLDGLEMHLRDRRVVFAFPTNDGLAGVFVGWPAGELKRVRADVEGQFWAALDAVGGLGERMRAGRRVERFAGATQLPNFLRRPHGPGWALVGDAGCHKDPLMALGCCDAFRDAELLAEAVVGGEGLATYERRRDEATVPDYERNLAGASLRGAPPDVLAIRAAVRGNAEATRRFFLAQAGLAAPASRSTIAA